MNKRDFILIPIKQNGVKSDRFINKSHIQQIYEKDNTVYIEITGYEVLEVYNENIQNLLDRFID